MQSEFKKKGYLANSLFLFFVKICYNVCECMCFYLITANKNKVELIIIFYTVRKLKIWLFFLL